MAYVIRLYASYRDYRRSASATYVSDNGRGNLVVTHEIEKALRFHSLEDAMAFWEHPRSRNVWRVWRSDGKPTSLPLTKYTRPLTKYKIKVVEVRAMSIPTKEKLAQALHALGFMDLEREARRGDYDDYESKKWGMPKVMLIKFLSDRLSAAGDLAPLVEKMIDEVKNGKWDNTSAEAQAYKRPARQLRP